ncbi:MAG: glycoside hydrolase family 2 TIM barrel-domain containing protein [Bacteroidota bacterium]
MIKHLLLSLSIILYSISLLAQTTIEKTDDAWTLLVDGEPFDIKGATFGYDKDTSNYDAYFKELNFLGVNTIRTWATGQHTPQLLDAAQRHGIKVMMGIWMRHGRPGMEDDDHFDYLTDTEGMQVMYDNAISVVQKYKDHPAVLTWGIGNEVYLNMATDQEKEAYSKLLERICKEIKSIDANHPITSVEAWTFGLDWWQNFVPSIDIYGLNSYGAGANFLSAELEKRGIDKPYIITEFGVTGEWDIQEEKNGIKVEPTDEQKYEAMVKGYQDWIKPKPACLGVYMFHYADDLNFLAAWLLTHFNGWTRPQYWAIREAYTGEQPINHIPKIENFQLPNSPTKSGTWVPVQIVCSDREQEELSVQFYYNQRTGSRKRRDQLLPLNARGSLAEGLEIQLPPEDGAIKVYAAVVDTYNNAGMASTSIIVQDEEASKRKYLVPKVSLPFYVYQDGEALPYAPSGYMGNYDAIAVDLKSTEEVYAGTNAIKISYDARENWYGIGFVDPANDWGDILGGYNISGAKKFSFWAKADDTNVKATIGFGLIEQDQSFPDTGKKWKEITLSKKWKKYTIKLKRTDLSCIRSGLVLFSSSSGFPHSIYIDEVVFE